MSLGFGKSRISRRLHARGLLLSLLLCLWVPAAFGASGSVTYAYDSLGRVTTASYNTGVIIIYTYDANGNQTQQLINLNNITAIWASFNWGAALWEHAGAAVWNSFNWDSAPWG